MLKIYTAAEAQQTILRRRPDAEETPASLQAGMQRVFGAPLTPEEGVRHILADVRRRGDAALRHWTTRIDGITLDSLAIPAGTLATALNHIPADLADALQLAAARIRAFHQHQPLPNWSTTSLGGRLGQRVTPLRRVGVYVPGGTAPLPSSLLMAVIPAQVAGVQEIVVATPPAGVRPSSIPPSWPPPTSPASAPSTPSAGRRPSPPWPTAAKQSPP